jgi:hypothetical protein
MTIRADAHKPEFHRAAPPQLPVRVATTANITIATALNNGDTIDGVTLATGDRVLVKDQSTGSQNGVYIAGVTPARAFDMAEGVAAYGAVIYVVDGTANGGKLFKNTNTTVPTIDTTALTFTEFSSGITGITVQDEGTPLATAATTLNFVGPLVAATGTGATKTVTVTGALDDLTDVTITSPASADRLRYNGSAWVNTTLIWRPVMAFDGTNWYVVVSGTDGAVMTEA